MSPIETLDIEEIDVKEFSFSDTLVEEFIKEYSFRDTLDP